MRVASPPIKHPCYMGINIPTKEELVANRVSKDKIAAHFGKTCLCYILLMSIVNLLETYFFILAIKSNDLRLRKILSQILSITFLVLSLFLIKSHSIGGIFFRSFGFVHVKHSTPQHPKTFTGNSFEVAITSTG